MLIQNNFCVSFNPYHHQRRNSSKYGSPKLEVKEYKQHKDRTITIKKRNKDMKYTDRKYVLNLLAELI